MAHNTYISGNVGIGSTTPAQALDVVGSIQFNGDLMPDGSAGTLGQVLQSNGTGTTPTWVDSGTLSGSLWDITSNVFHPKDEYASIVDVIVGGIATASADIQLFADGSAVFNEQGSDADFRVEGVGAANALFVQGSDGNIGIGTTGPGVALDVVGSIRLNAQMGNFIYLDTTNANRKINHRSIDFYYGDRADIANTHASGFLTFWTGGSNERVRIDTGGNVGIGTTSPIGLLNVEGAVTGKALSIFNETGDQAIFTASASGTTRVTINNAGDIIPGTDDTQDLGSSSLRWQDLYLGPASLHIGTDGNEGIISYDTTNNYLGFDPDGDATNEVVFQDDGNVGIGTTSASNFPLEVGGNAGPSVDDSYSLGSASLRWSNIYSSGDLIATGLSDADLDTKIQVEESADEDKIRFDTAGTERMIIDENGLVGIGDGITPIHGFEVNKAVTGKALVLLQELGDQDILTASNSAGVTRFRMANTGYIYAERFVDISNSSYYVDPAGGITSGVFASNVGIGSTTPAYKLDVVGEFNLTDAIRVAGDAGNLGYLLTSSAGGANTWTDPDDVGLWTNTLNVFHPKDEYASVVDLALGGTSTASANIHLRSDGQAYFGGNVGIGTSIPEQLLTLRGPGDTRIRINNTDGDGHDWSWANDWSGYNGFSLIEEGVNGDVIFFEEGSGNVGIGTATPAEKLDVNGSFKLKGSSGGYTLLESGYWSWNHTAGNSNDKWIKIADLTLNGSYSEAGVVWETRPRVSNHGDSNEKISVQFRNSTTGIESSYNIEHNIVGGGEKSLKDVRVVRYSGTGTSNNRLSVWVQGSATWLQNIGWIASYHGTVALNKGTLTQYASIPDTGTTYNTTSLYSIISGNVGIGTATPSQELDIIGDIELQNTTSNDTGIIYKGTNRFIHNYQHPTGSTATPIGRNTFIGINAGNFSMGSTATATYHGSYNTAVGYVSLEDNTTGYYNTAHGNQTLSNNISGYQNTAIGMQTLAGNTTGYSNTAAGYVALVSNTTGYYNAAYGYTSLYSNSTGAYNIAMGSNSGRYTNTGSSNQLSNYGVYLGNDTRSLASTSSNEIVIGSGARGLGSNTVIIGNTSITKTELKGNVGIGTASPAEKLKIYTSSDVNMLRISRERAESTSMYYAIFDRGTYVDHEFLLRADGNAYADGSWNGGGADVAELYMFEESVQPGDLVSIPVSSNNPGKTMKKSAGKPYDTMVIGVVSTDPGLVAGFGEVELDITDGSDTRKPVALVGRVPVKVSLENGPIYPGDYLTSSSTPGIAMKSTQPGKIIGQAMEEYTGSVQKSIGVINIEQDYENKKATNLPSIPPLNANEAKIMVYVFTGYHDPSISLTDTGEVTIDRDNANGYTVTNSGNNITSISSIYKAFIANITAGLINTQELIVETTASITDLAVSGTASISNLSVDSLTINGQSLVDYITGVVGGQVASNGTTLISPVGDDTVITIATQSGQIAFTNSNDETVAAISESGDLDINGNLNLEGSISANGNTTILGNLTANNASISGQLNADSITTTGSSTLGSLLVNTDATISGSLTIAQNTTIAGNLTTSGTLLATQIETTSARITTLEAGMAELEHIKATTAELVTATVSGTLYADSIYANSIYDFEETLLTTLQQPSLLDIIMGVNSSTTSANAMEDLYNTINKSEYNATSSADLDLSFSEVNMTADDVILTGTALFVEKYFKVNGAGYISDSLAVGNSLFIGNSMQIADGLINYTTTDPTNQVLEIQPKGQGSIELLAGIVTIDDSGKVTVNGDLDITGNAKIAGTLLTDQLKPTDFGNPLQVQVAGIDTQTNEVKKSRFEIINEVGTPVATFSAEGNAQFAGKVDIAGGIGIGSQDLGSSDTNELTTDKTSGKATIKSGANEVTINSSIISDNTLIYVTAVGSTDNQVIYVKNQIAEDTNTPEQEGKFVVGFDNDTSTDISFNWWIVN